MTFTDGVSFGKVGAFRFWCQKVLPAVYDDSLSYYELLCKVVHYLNNLIEVTNTQSDAIAELQETLAEFMAGEFDSYIEEKVDEWFEEHEPDIVAALEELDDKIDDTYKSIKNLSWNCNFRTIVRDCYDLSKTNSVQGFTHFVQNGIEYIAQAYLFDTESVIVIYNYKTMAEVDRISGNYGHLNDVSYNENTLYCLNESEQTIYTFEFINSTISYTGMTTISNRALGICYTSDNIWYVDQGTNIIYIFKCDYSFNIIDTYTIPNVEPTYIQGISVNNNRIAIAATAPNTIIIYDLNIDDYYFVGVPISIGHCIIDEVEGVSILDNDDIIFNTNSVVDMQLICSIFVTNLKHNVQKELETCITLTRYNQIQVTIDSVNGSLTAPSINGVFKLAGDAINYAKNLGNYEIMLDFVNDYPYPIVINGANVMLTVEDENTVVNLNGLICRYSTVYIQRIGRFVLHPTSIQSLIQDGVTYGGYVLNCDFSIGASTWHQLPDPEVYDSTHMKIYFLDSDVKIQDVTYNRYYNCILCSSLDTEVSSSIYERTGLIKHSS